MMVELKIGQKVKLKKGHPCGSQWWQIQRVGADIRIKCEGCGHLVMVSRFKLLKSIQEIKEN